MKTKVRSVAVKRLPERITAAQRDQVFAELESSISVDRPAVVLDCSALRQVDSSGIHLLLCCLEEAMKRTGDVRLAALRPEVQTALKTAEVDSLFQSFEALGEAVESFHRPQFEFVQFDSPVQSGEKSRMNAA